MGYPNANMGIFLNADLKGIRQLAGFLIEYMSKYDEKEKVSVQEDLSNVLALRVQRELQKWRAEPWIMPEFLDHKRDVYLTRFHIHNGSLFVPQLVEHGGVGAHSLVSNSLEFVKEDREREAMDARISVEIREDNQEQVIHVSRMRRAFADAYAGKSDSRLGATTSMWERKRLAREQWLQRVAEEGNAFAQKVLLRRKKRMKQRKVIVPEKKEEAPAVEEKKQEEAKTEEEKKESEHQETPLEAFQKKLESLKLEKEKEIQVSQDWLSQLDRI